MIQEGKDNPEAKDKLATNRRARVRKMKGASDAKDAKKVGSTSSLYKDNFDEGMRVQNLQNYSTNKYKNHAINCSTSCASGNLGVFDDLVELRRRTMECGSPLDHPTMLQLQLRRRRCIPQKEIVRARNVQHRNDETKYSCHQKYSGQSATTRLFRLGDVEAPANMPLRTHWAIGAETST